MGYHHFSIAERGQLDALYRLNWTTRQIAVHLGRHHSIIAREVRRGRQAEGYHAPHAHNGAVQRRRASCPRGKYTPSLVAEITQRLRQTWSPAQIAAYHRMHNYPSVSFKTMYRWLYRMRLYPVSVSVLRHKGKRRQPPDRRGQFAAGTPIHQRPKEVCTRTTFGHWEADTMVSSRGKSRACVATFIERKTRWYTAIAMPDRSAASMNRAIATLQQLLPPGTIHSLTVDRGKEFATHASITRALGIPLYFADSFAAWQRGSNENANGLLREFFPKKTDFATISDAQLAAALHAINQRPRKCLHWQLAQDLFTHTLSHLN